jgi:hypothetical protein
MDNLLAHHNQMVVQMIHAYGHRVVFRAPYWPVDGPIEHVFNTIEGALARRMYQIDGLNDVTTHVLAVIRQMPNFVNYFLNCGCTN